jgi:hypothetical protein
MRALMERVRTGTPSPEPAEELTYVPLSHITGAAAVYAVLLRVALATNAEEVLGMAPCADVAFTCDDVWWYFRTSWEVIHLDAGNRDWISGHGLDDHVWEAEERLYLAKKTMWKEMRAAEDMRAAEEM